MMATANMISDIRAPNRAGFEISFGGRAKKAVNHSEFRLDAARETRCLVFSPSRFIGCMFDTLGFQFFF
jgi:hypothetical protein